MSQVGKTLLLGHTLWAEGKGYGAYPCVSCSPAMAYDRIGTGGPGHARCSCGAVSPHLDSGTKRKAWHRAHKQQIREQT